MPSTLLPRRVHPRKRPCWRRAVTSALGHKRPFTDARLSAPSIVTRRTMRGRTRARLSESERQHHVHLMLIPGFRTTVSRFGAATHDRNDSAEWPKAAKGKVGPDLREAALGRSTRELLDLIDRIGKAGEWRQVRPQAQAVGVSAGRGHQAPRCRRDAGGDRQELRGRYLDDLAVVISALL